MSYPVEVFKYPYCNKSIESEEFLSEKIRYYITRVRKKSIKKAKWLIVYGDFLFRLTNSVVPSQTISLPILPTTPPIMRYINSDTGFSKKVIIARVINDRPDRIAFYQQVNGAII